MLPPFPVVPWTTSGLFEPLGVVGKVMEFPANTPAGVYSSRNTELPVLTSVWVPSPTRQTTMLPAVKACAAVTSATAANRPAIDD